MVSTVSSGTSPLDLRLAGYFPKQVVPRPEALACPAVQDICSVAACLAQEPEDWHDHWLHNGLGFFNTLELANRVIPPGSAGMTMFAYRLLPVRYRHGQREAWTWPADVSPEPLDPAFQSLGFDPVCWSEMGTLTFEHSPLFCNYMADEWPVNRHCLLDDLETAIAAAEAFSIEEPEPGLYYVAEVLAHPF